MSCPKCGNDSEISLVCVNCGKVLKMPRFINIVSIIFFILGMKAFFFGLVYSFMSPVISMKESPVTSTEKFLSEYGWII